jgi:hypothetical protein
MRVDLGGRHIGVSEQLLRRAYVIARFQQMSREGMTQCVAGSVFPHSALLNRQLHGPLNQAFMDMMPANLPTSWVAR